MVENPCLSFRAVYEMDCRAHPNKKFPNMKYEQAKLDESSVHGLEDKATEVQHFCSEPKSDNVPVDGELCLSKENSWRHLEIEDFYFGLDYDLKRNYGGLDCITQGQDGLELGAFDGLLDKVDDIHAANDISRACEDFLFDIEFVEKICNLDYAPSERSHVENSSSENRSPGFSGSSNGVLGFSESSAATPLESNCKNVSIEKDPVKCESNGSLEEKIDCRTLAGEHEFTALDFQQLDVLDDAWPLDSGISSDKNEMKTIHASKRVALFGQRRLRRPTKRYVEELSTAHSKRALDTHKGLDTDSENECLTGISHYEHNHNEDSSSETITQETHQVEGDEKLSVLKCKCATGKRKVFYSSSPKDKRIKIGSRNGPHHVRSPKSAPLDESITVGSEEPFNSRPRRGRPKKLPSVTVFDFDDKQSESDSEDDHMKRRTKKSGDRRKHQRMWTLSEVTKLIDGIAHYGTGRWTDIKKLSFSSSAYRTPIDLRDKWRNLLRACSANKQKQNKNKKEDGQKANHAIGTLPKNVIHRIRELADLHPYPRFNPGGRYKDKRRKN